MTKIAFIGDIHNKLSWLNTLAKDLPEDVDTIIQVGDMGLYPGRHLPTFDKKIYFIDGNHENFPLLRGKTEITEIFSNLWYIPRGTVLEINGVKLGLCGGGESIDKAYRTPEFDWFADETVTEGDISKLRDETDIDALIVHSPPLRTINFHIPNNDEKLRRWGIPRGWVNISSLRIEQLWDALGNPFLICGHMHQSVTGENYRWLDIGEVYIHEFKD